MVQPPPPPSKRAQSIDFAPIEDKAVGDADFPLYAVASSGLPVTFACAHPHIATVHNHRHVRVIGEGTTQIVASQAGNGEYEAARAVAHELVVARRREVLLEVRSRHLARAHVALVAAMPRFLGVKRVSDLCWDEGEQSVLLRGAPPQVEELNRLLAGFKAMDDCVGRRRALLQKQLWGRCDELAAAIRQESPGLAPEDPVRVVCREYMKLLRESWSRSIEEALRGFDAFVGDRAAAFVGYLLARHQSPCAAVSGELEAKAEDLTRLIGPESKHEALKHFVQSERYKLPAGPDESQRIAFRHFSNQILERGRSSPFLLSIILRDYCIHLASVQRNLPFYCEAAREMLDAVQSHHVTVVRTATGSGKSTLMPLLLLASGQGYRRIAVTQPRRFAAESIQAKIQELHGATICGYQMAGKSRNPRAPIQYITDGLLRTMLGPDGLHPFDVIIIDEVHERSMEIDTCIALLALCHKREGRMPKVILSSATFDQQVVKPFLNAGASVANLEQRVRSKFKCVEHYGDEACSAGCSICLFLKRSHHHLDVVMKLHGLMERDDQLLCFLPSQKEVTDAVQRMTELNINAKPLYSQQNGAMQLQFLRSAKVFFSTNIAETSLTFPSLRYVVDCGLVQRPRCIGETWLMETVPAPNSTLRQRLGRVGRTMNGDYVALYKKRSGDPRQENISPKMELERHEDLLFSLQCQLKRAVKLDFPALKDELHLDELPSTYFRFPVLGGKKMADAFFAAQQVFKCGDEVFLLAALRMSFQPKTLQELASKAQLMFPGSTGDISTAVFVLRRLDASVPQNAAASDALSPCVVAWCNRHGLTDFSSQLIRAYRHYTKMKSYYLLIPPSKPHNQSHKMFHNVAKTDFDCKGREWNGFLFGRKNADGSPDMNCAENYEKPKRLERCTNFTQVIQALAAGFQANYFVHCPLLDGPINYYSRASDLGDGGDRRGDPIKTLSSMHTRSTLAKRKPDLPKIIFALDFMLFGAEMPRNEDPFRLGVLQMIETVQSTDEMPASLNGVRKILLHSDDVVPFPTETDGAKRYCVIAGALGKVIEDEIKLRRQLRSELKVTLLAKTDEPLMTAQIKANLEQLRHDRQVFNPLKFLWGNAHGVQVELHMTSPSDPHVKVLGRRRDIGRFNDHFQFWRRQLALAPMVERPDHFISVDLYRRPRTLPSGDAEFRERLHTVTAQELSQTKLFLKCQGPHATRETRMEVVARIAVQTFGCKLCGGFLRDWIVNGERKHPPTPLKDWVEEPAGTFTKYEIAEGVIPKDLDLELPMEKYFDVGRFVSEVRQCGIMVDHHEHIAQRHVFLMEQERGPFTVDLVEPHFAVLHTLADFDVNTMCVVAYPDLIGLKMRYRLEDGTELSVDDVVANCRQRQLYGMQAAGGGAMAVREKKMTDRGWRKLGQKTFVPVNPQLDYSVCPLHDKSEALVAYRREIETRISKGAAKVRAMYEIRSSIVDGHYLAMRDEFVKTLGDANEALLFHGTDDTVVEPILRGGFDDRFWRSSGYFGRGAYFADDPNLSVSFTKAPPGGGPRSIFVCSVLLGRVDDRSANPISQPMGADFYPGAGFNSVKGRIQHGAPPTLREMEYIVYRYGQAKPRYLIRFDYN